MEFVMMGVSYENVEMEALNAIFLSDTTIMEMYLYLQNKGIGQAVILSTCNRKELYSFCEDDQLDIIEELLKQYFHDAPLMMLTGEQAYHYFFEVVSGLHSLVLGEDQILGQVVNAMEFSQRCGSLKKELTKVFREGITCAKEIKREIHISEHPLSISYIAIKELAGMTKLEGKKALVIGSGKMASLALTYLKDDGIEEIVICNRSKENALKLLDKYPDIKIKDYHERYEAMQECDIVVSATSSPHLVIERDKIQLGHLTYLVDLALPRDIDEDFFNDDQAVLIDMASLQRTADTNKEKRKQCTLQAKEIITQYIEDLKKWFESERVDESLMKLQHYYQQVVDDTYSILDNKLNLDDHEKYVLKRTLNIMKGRLLKQPIQVLKQLDESEQNVYNQVIDELFTLKEED